MEFNEEKHEYVHNNQVYTSVTQLLKKYGLSADYTGIPDAVLKKAATRGRAVHKALELFVGGDQSMLGLMNEVDLFNKYVTMSNIDLTQAKSEQLYYDTNYKIAGTIDFQYDLNNEHIIADFKTTSSLHLDTVAWQLSIYNFLMTGGDIMNYYFNKLKVYHFTAGKLYVKDVYTVDYDQVKALLEANLQGLPDFVYVKTTKVISDADVQLLSQLSKEIVAHQAVLDELEKQRDTVLNSVKEEMIKQKDYFYRSSEFDLIYTAPQIRKSLDTGAVKQYVEDTGGDIEKLMKETTTKDGIKMRIKK